ARATMDLARMQQTKMDLNLNRELMAQGVGNMASSALGGLPVTGVIVRSAANLQFGARSRWSAVLHGIWIILFASLGAQLLNHVPLTALAAVLVVTGVKLVNVAYLQELMQTRFREASIWLATFVGILATD